MAIEALAPEDKKTDLTPARDKAFIGTRGLPPIPSREERDRNMAKLLSKMDEWLAEDPAYDLETYAELERGLREHPLTFRQVRLDG